MPLSSELVSQFAKLANNKPKEEKESTVYGTTVIQNDNKYVKLDGSELLTPASFTTNIADGERVTVLIKNHMAIVTGNITSPAARSSEVEEVGDKADAASAAVKDLTADNVTIKNKLNAQEASIGNLEAENVTITGKLEAAEGNISNLQADNVTINESLTAAKASIKNLDTKKLSADQADIKYANIDFTNIGKAAIENFYATSGIIKDLVIGDTSVTGKLVGVTITGDLIEGGTVKADKLVILGEDGLYYKLNVNALGETTAASDPKYQNGLDGSVIVAKSITAEKVNVHDLVAFDATIGGFNISDSSIYSGAKESVTNGTRGIYLDKNGQISFGDADNFIRYYKDTDGTYKLEISSNSITMSISTQIESVREELKDDTDKKLSNYVTNTEYTDNKNNTDNRINEIRKYITFTKDGIKISSDSTYDNPDAKHLTLTIDNDAIKFENNGVVIGEWDGENFYTGDMVVKLNQRAQFGNFAFVPRSDKSLMFLKVKD